jgi:hypothetical protein
MEMINSGEHEGKLRITINENLLSSKSYVVEGNAVEGIVSPALDDTKYEYGSIFIK